MHHSQEKDSQVRFEMGAAELTSVKFGGLIGLLTVVILVGAPVWSWAQEKSSQAVAEKKPLFVEPPESNLDFDLQGEYVGQVSANGEGVQIGIQVVALGNAKFQAVAFHGGLPGDGWDADQESLKLTQEGDVVAGKATLKNEFGHAIVENGKVTVKDPTGETILGELKKVKRQSKTLGAKPPKSATVLFDGSDTDQWVDGKMDENQLLQQGTTSRSRFGSHRLHLEFRVPFKPMDRGQARGNSGLYVQGRYEVQILDSFGLAGKMNECGGIYSVKDCDFNMSFPPLSWQTFDIEYQAAQFDGDRLVENPRMTVYHNGVKIHDNVELPGDRSTTAAPVKPGPGHGPVFLQNHGNPVRFRNIWVVEDKKSDDE